MDVKIVFNLVNKDFELLSKAINHFYSEKLNFDPIKVVLDEEYITFFDNSDICLISSYKKESGIIVFSNFIEKKHSDKIITYADDQVRKMAKELSAKTKLLKKLKKKLRKSYTLARLEKIHKSKKSIKLNSIEYDGIYGFDNDGYMRDEAKIEAQVELLEDMIDSKKKKRWMYY